MEAEPEGDVVVLVLLLCLTLSDTPSLSVELTAGWQHIVSTTVQKVQLFMPVCSKMSAACERVLSRFELSAYLKFRDSAQCLQILTKVKTYCKI